MASEKSTPLSEREMELLQLVATGATNQQIAKKLHISVNTVKVHLRNIFEKLGVESRTEATLVAIREGWVTLDRNAVIPEPAAVQPPPLARISLRQRVFLVLSAVIIFGLAFLPPLGSRLVQSQARSPFTEHPTASPLLIPDERATRWIAMPAMLTPRARLAGVYHEGKLYAIGGDTDTGVSAATEVYDLATNRWSALPDKPTPVSNVSAVVVAGRIWVPGGFLADGRITAVVEAFDVESGTWVPEPSLPEPICAYALAALDEDIYLFGGANNQGYLDVAYRFDSEAGEWQPLPRLPAPRAFAAAAPLNGRIYVVGGYDGKNESPACHVYDPAEERAGRPPWSTCASLSMGRGGLGLAVVGSTLYAVGGGWQNFLAYNEQYNPEEGRWSSFSTPVAGEWRNVAVASDSQRVYVFGGWSGRYLNTLQAYRAIVTVFLPITP